MIRIILVILLLAIPGLGFCYCGPLTSSDEEIAIEKVYVDSSQVFIGKVVKIDLSDSQTAKIIFKIQKQYKGEKASEISIFQPVGIYKVNENGAWQYEEDSVSFKQGKEYIVYTAGAGEQLTVLPCSRTRPLVDAYIDATKDIATLDKVISDPHWKFDEQRFAEWRYPSRYGR